MNLRINCDFPRLLMSCGQLVKPKNNFTVNYKKVLSRLSYCLFKIVTNNLNIFCTVISAVVWITNYRYEMREFAWERTGIRFEKSTGMGMKMNIVSWPGVSAGKWEGLGTKNPFPHRRPLTLGSIWHSPVVTWPPASRQAIVWRQTLMGIKRRLHCE